MAHKRSRRKKSLYEIIGATGSKAGYDRAFEQLQQEKTTADSSEAGWMPEKLSRWPKKPRIVQLNAGRIELSIPYQIGIALLLGVVLLILIVFRLGQATYLSSQGTSQPAVETPKSVQKAPEQTVVRQVSQPVRSTVPASALAEKVEQHISTGSNRIVIQTYQLRTHLEPVKQYFAARGIATEIREIGGMYYLVTSRKYQNPDRKGTDGYIAKQRIIELGADYKAPPGYESFGRKPFHDSYGMRFDD